MYIWWPLNPCRHELTFCFRQAVHAAASFLGSGLSGRSSVDPGPVLGPRAASALFRFKEADMVTSGSELPLGAHSG